MQGQRSMSLSLSLALLSTILTCLAMVEMGLAARAYPNFIKACCASTLYPTLCFNSLSPYASTIKTSHREMAHIALLLSLDKANAMSAMISKTMVGLNKDESSRRAASAMKDCMENIEDSIDELRESLDEDEHLPVSNEGADFREKMGNIQTWVSAALTDEDTCMDGFKGVSIDGNLRDEMRRSVLAIAHLTSNALALINSLNQAP
ncbi:21 kDa protein [Amborella trichopoda]|nr:21 kDa protein [Amborella trichopoda]|eukprot:XP_006843218.3 21 kDa protein [Amborella trichopoda]